MLNRVAYWGGAVKRIVVGIALLVAATPCASAQNFLHFPDISAWQVGTGVDYSVGRYGDTRDTTVVSVPLDAKIQLDRLRLAVTIPYLDITGPGTLVGDVIVDTGTVNTRTGLGDINVGAAYLVSADADTPALEVEGFAKLPTAETGLGTGKVDYVAQANLYHALTPQFTVFGSIGYQWLSDFSTFDLKNGVVASAGLNLKVSDDTSIGFSANFRQESFDSRGDTQTLSPYVMWNFVEHWRLTGYGTVGTGDASPNFGGGMRLIVYR